MELGLGLGHAPQGLQEVCGHCLILRKERALAVGAQHWESLAGISGTFG